MMARSQGVIITTVIFSLLSTGSVVLRVISRFNILRKPSADDYLIMVGLMMSWTLAALNFAQVRYGLGQHQDQVSADDLQNMFLCLWLWFPVYNITLTIAKLSAMFQFLRFFVMRGPRITAWILISIVSMFGIAISVALICSCLPVQSYWIAALPGECLDFLVLWYFNSSFNVATDIAVVVLPLYVLRDLRLPRRQKRAVMGVFAIASLTCITSVIRLITIDTLIKGGDNTYYNAPPTLWSTVEANTAIICACMQSLKPLIQKIRPEWFEHSQASSNGLASHQSCWKMSTLRTTTNINANVDADEKRLTNYEPVLGEMLGGLPGERDRQQIVSSVD